jgi:hypothetical protein
MLDMNCPTCPNGFQWSVWYHVPSTLKELAFRSRRRLEQIGGPRPAEPAR